MKNHIRCLAHRTTRLSSLAAVVVAGFVGTTLAQEDRPEPRRDLPSPERRAPGAPGEGRRDEPRPARPPAGLAERSERLGGDGVEQRLRQLQQRMSELQQQIEQLRQAGPMRNRAHMMNRFMGPRREPGRPAMERKLRGPNENPNPNPSGMGLAQREETQRRLHHLQAAIENLHAAGLHEPAERLSQARQQMMQGKVGAPSQPGQPQSPAPELRQLREEIKELRGALNEMKNRMQQPGR